MTDRSRPEAWSQRKGNGKAQDDYWALKAWALARVGRTSEVAEAIEKALKHTDKSAAPDMATTHYAPEWRCEPWAMSQRRTNTSS